ncbi:EscF/YscF/HrpA family type III secretion system needle major subunit [uncultured Bilophila sp.]|uniref:EscF/YscF/HrpA family type III secretion system needle major subunit n=1 Tax=uncultured Bilophila sp. TaxID=529385 RepID=UPI0025D3F199|nr:EscF/YscF/HrpA family type III secretion system needle major subunit [uncultured Bilophila sp.]
MNIGSTSGTPGLNVNELFNSGLDSISKKGQALQTKMNEMLSQDQVSPEDMMALQFEVGQYNAMMESLSSVTKSMTDMMKSLAQRTG